MTASLRFFPVREISVNVLTRRLGLESSEMFFFSVLLEIHSDVLPTRNITCLAVSVYFQYFNRHRSFAHLERAHLRALRIVLRVRTDCKGRS